ncbi:2TM domain-containing protein [Flavobacterium sp. '19STA2R22 D10 B1']|uniref:2TM domain-containing protein n=1 Tax=Flavobacterium aerium TaxID=3037261 RepID=UPI00278C4DD8|nr:2TM domain-containing protein [Flavobacterium sp. '19STA2R22 D10 B1']
MERNYQNEERYLKAQEQVKKIRGFYTHFVVYLVVNAFIVVYNINHLEPGESYFKYSNFITAFCWGIGLVIHAATTFIPNMIFGKNWEEKKIKKLMEEEKREKWE